MASFSTETEVTTDVAVALDIEVTVQDQDGNNIDCDIDGNDLELRAQIDTSNIREELEDELRQEIEDQFVSDIAESINPFQELADLLAKTGRSYEMRQNRIKANTKLSNERNLVKSDVITGLRAENEVLQQTVVSLKEQVERLVKAAADKAQGGPLSIIKEHTERISKEHADQFGDV
jgi:hypothetical protein